MTAALTTSCPFGKTPYATEAAARAAMALILAASARGSKGMLWKPFRATGTLNVFACIHCQGQFHVGRRVRRSDGKRRR